MTRPITLAMTSLALAALAPLVARAATPPAPFGPTPTERQLAWHEIETYGFIHFGLNTFTGREWGYGDEDPKLFNPVEFDADQIVGAFKSAGLKGVLMVAKHHDGFCLWPTKSTPHNISQSPYKNGKGDLVREVAEACKRAGMKFGVYISPWDRNNPEYGKPGYVAAFHKQIAELTSGYGPMFEIWFDGANGGDGWYGGAKAKRTIDKDTYYQWDKVRDIIRKNQPQAVIFSGGFPDVRWVGNERGVAGEVCRNRVPAKVVKPSGEDPGAMNRGDKNGDRWVPAECDVSIRPGWFYHAGEDARVKTPRQLLDLYFVSVGRGASLLLNIPPDKRGLVHENDVKSLKGFGELLRQTFSVNLAAGAKASSAETRGRDEAGFGPAKVLDADRHSYWATDDAAREGSVTLTLPEARTFNIVRLREPLKLGERVDGWKVEVFESGAWREYAKGEVVGNCRLVRGAPVTTDRIRVTVASDRTCPALSEIALFAEPADLGAPAIARDRKGLVTLKTGAGVAVRYTTDGSEPVAASPAYDKPFALPLGGTVKAKAFAGSGASGDTATGEFGLAKAKWSVAGASAGAETAANAIDDNPKSLWYTHEKSGRKAPPQWISVNLGETVRIAAFTVTPRADGTDHGLVDQYRFEVSDDGATWRQVAEGEFSNIRANPIEQTVKLATPVSGKYFRFTGLRCLAGDQVAIGELGVIPAK